MDIVKSISTWIVDGIKSIIDLLPDSPFQLNIPSNIQELLGYVNYFIPINLMVKTLIAWTACVVVFYASMVFMRWLKAID